MSAINQEWLIEYFKLKDDEFLRSVCEEIQKILLKRVKDDL